MARRHRPPAGGPTGPPPPRTVRRRRCGARGPRPHTALRGPLPRGRPPRPARPRPSHPGRPEEAREALRAIGAAAAEEYDTWTDFSLGYVLGRCLHFDEDTLGSWYREVRASHRLLTTHRKSSWTTVPLRG
ncbi:DUF1266 domain-containing protein [Streptomyces smyrnaeus]|uniref:DUF1266 domain-containing protein n=1 Tax=Streptomyces smyrnaeus TaxID=1387713 RepID=A0ABS3Y159_9ACTN|nr:DUF1266 domain-containing protein [Streptomyces smyrnaeus]